MRRRVVIAASIVFAVTAGGVLWLGSGDADSAPTDAKTAIARVDKEPRRKSRDRAPRTPVPAAVTMGTIAGQVIQSGAAAPHARVSLRSEGLFEQITAGADGTFQFRQVPAGAFLLSADHEGAASDVVGPILMAHGQTYDGIVLELLAGATVSGTIRDARTLQPIPGAQVRSSSGTTLSDHAGRYRLGPLPATGTYLEASAPGFAPRAEWLSLDGAREQGGMDFHLRAGQVLRGQVTRLGTPVAGASVWAEDPYLSAQQHHFGPVTTSADGRFELQVAVGELQLAAAGPDEARVPGPRLTVVEGADVGEINLELGQSMSANGNVTLDGHPLESASLFLIDARSQQSAGSASTSAGGAFRFEGVPPGAYLVQVHAGAVTAQRGPFQLTGAEDAPWNIDLQSGRRLHGRVVPAQPGVTVRWRSSDFAGSLLPETLTDVDGRFAFDAVPDGVLVVEASAPSGTARVEGTAGDEIVLRLETSMIVGHALDDRSRPVTDFVVRAVPRTGGVPQVRSILDPRGEFELPVTPGVWEVTASAVGVGEAEASEPVAVSAGGRSPRVVLRFQASHTLAGQVVDWTSGAPLAGAEVAVLPEGLQRAGYGQRAGPVVTDSGGRFTVVVPTGRARLRVRKTGFETMWFPVGDDAALQQRLAWYARRAGPPVGNTRGGATVFPMIEGASREREPQPYEGIGMVLRPHPGGHAVGSVLDGGPAQAAGVLPGDEIVAVDGWSTHGARVEHVTSRIMGPSGTLVRLTLRRGDRTVEVVVRRRAIQL